MEPKTELEHTLDELAEENIALADELNEVFAYLHDLGVPVTPHMRLVDAVQIAVEGRYTRPLRQLALEEAG